MLRYAVGRIGARRTTEKEMVVRNKMQNATLMLS